MKIAKEKTKEMIINFAWINIDSPFHKAIRMILFHHYKSMPPYGIMPPLCDTIEAAMAFSA
jgi:hypothetical protein